MQTNFTIGVEFIENNSDSPSFGRLIQRTWHGVAQDEQEAMYLCSDFYGFERDEVEVTDFRILDDEPPQYCELWG